ncbi:MAG: hypothetical protein JXR36_13870 [Bacteroidales bacterium]|nr:hypothetical protein [Bacteroidales bacterium]
MNRKFNFLWAIVVFTIATTMHFSCSTPNSKQEMVEIYELDQITGASGVINIDEDIFIVCDNSPYLYKLDRNLRIVDKIAIYDTSGFINGEIAKKDKPDFESMELIGNCIYILGSGSKSPQRDILVKVLLDDMSVTTFDTTTFYSDFALIPEMNNVELNIEGLAYYKESIFLFNRMNNLIVAFDYMEFENAVTNGGNFPKYKAVTIKLPTINGIEAGLSGATISQSTGKLYLTASVENTEDSYNDGEILGSFVASVPLSSLYNDDSFNIIQIDNNGDPVKAESICILSNQSDKNDILGIVTDSDGGESLFLKLQTNK